MKIDSPAELLQKIDKNTKAFNSAVSSGDQQTAQRLAVETAALYNRLAKKVPHREQLYRTRAKEWTAKAEECAGMIKVEAQDADTGILQDVGATAPVPGDAVKSTPAPTKPVRQVFISYSSPDRTLANDLCLYLEAQGISCWIAPRDVVPGSDFPGSIIDAIDASTIMVLIFSKSSNNSPHVMRELTRAVTRNMLIIPFRIEEILPTKNMDYLINIAQWYNAMPPPPQQHFGALTETIKSHLSGQQTEKPGPASSGG
ncbi:MAG: toll/interleukin-1 receptor domain-containing protein [Methanoregula sp.]|nr:toll/interleukin-1 receptor domain-containing protein [Methanoregula sp.]